MSEIELSGAAAIELGVSPERALEGLRAHAPLAHERTLARTELQTTRSQQLQDFMGARFAVEPDAASGGPLLPAERHFELAAALKRELGYSMYVTCCATHFLAQKQEAEHFEVATVLRLPAFGSTHASWRVSLPLTAELDSLVPLFAGADWQEREQYDLVGVRFRGHPDLRRIMLPEEWEGHPLRRDYAIDTGCAPWR